MTKLSPGMGNELPFDRRRIVATALGVAALCLLSGCALSHRAAPLEDLDAPLDGARPDVARPDVGDAWIADERGLDTPDAPVCIDGVESCDGVDQDCDARVDEDAVCTLPAATSMCSGGRCNISACLPDRLDCNGMAEDGCETDPLADRLHCGGCGIACSANALCEAGSCVREAILDVEPQLQFTVVLLASGRLVAWGTGIPLPSGEAIDSSTPIVIEGAPRADLMASTGTAVLVVSDGRLYGWGANDGAELAQGFMSEPGVRLPLTEIVLPTTRPLTRLAAGASRWLAVADRPERVYFWGAIKADGTVDPEGMRPRLQNFRGEAGTPLADLTVAGDSFAARFEGGVGMRIWGYARHGIAADEIDDGRWLPRPGGTGPGDDLDCGRAHCCSNHFGRSVLCWGRREHGRLGAETGAGPIAAAEFPLGWDGAVATLDVATSDPGASCVLQRDHTLLCWGEASGNGLGLGRDQPTPALVDVAWPEPATGLRAGVNMCAIVGAERLACWGDNAQGALGPASTGAPPRFMDGFE